MNHKERLYRALKSECEANINEALLTLDMCFLKGTAIGEHTSEHFLEEATKALTGLWFRLNDKIQRLKNLVVLGEPDTVGESLTDTFQDLSVYGIIAQIVQQKKFK